MIAVEAFKIMVAKAILGGLDMEMHTLVYDEKLNQLKHDLTEKWLSILVLLSLPEFFLLSIDYNIVTV